MNKIMIATEYPGVFGIEHLLYLGLFILLFALGLYIVSAKIKTERSKTLMVKISALLLFIFIAANRISIVYTNIYIYHNESYTWLNLIPNSFCGLSSLVLSLAVLFGKKDNKVLHCICYIGFFGGFITMIYPDFLDSQTFWDIRSITGLLHHTFMVWLVILMVKTQYFIPSLKKWYIFPIGLCIMITFGVFEIDCLGFDHAMQISHPLLSSLPVLSSWYVVGSVALALQLGFLFLYEKVKEKRNQTYNE